MTPRERFRAVVHGEPVDRLPFMFGYPRTSTFQAWRRQGLSEEQQARFGSWIGMDPWIGFGKFDTRPVPCFDEQVIWERDNQREWIDDWGVRRIDAINQPTLGFATRKYLEFPVKGMADWEAMKFRYQPTPDRLIPIPGEGARATLNPDGYRSVQGTVAWNDPAHMDRLNHGDAPATLTVPCLYWTLRDWCGFEGLSMMFYTDPECVHAMMAHWTEFIITLLDEPLRQVKLDQVILNEDMAYKHAAMLSPDMMREFMLPHYQELYRFFKARGVEAVVMDSDGHNGQLIDVFYPTGFDGIAPMEIAAANDPGDYLARYPGLYLQGGIDKRELREQPRARAEIVHRFRQARQHGRYIPGVDHGVPPDVPLRTFLYLVELSRGLSMGEDLDTFEPAGALEAQLGELECLFDPYEAILTAQGHDD